MNRKRLVMILLVIALLLIGTWFIFSCQLQKNEAVPEEEPIQESTIDKKEEQNRKEDLLTDRGGQEELVDQDKADTKQESDKPAKNDSSQKSEKPQTEKTGHYEERQELVKEAYDEKVLVKKGECRDVLVAEAYDSEEMVYLDGAFYGPDTQEGYVCNGCGAVFFDASINDHIGSPEHPGWHNELIETSEPYWHNVEYKTVHHDAVYRTECEEDEYEIIHHDAEYRTVKVWVED